MSFSCVSSLCIVFWLSHLNIMRLSVTAQLADPRGILQSLFYYMYWLSETVDYSILFEICPLLAFLTLVTISVSCPS